MIDARFYSAKGPFTLRELAVVSGATCRCNGEALLSGVAPFGAAHEKAVAFLDGVNAKKIDLKSCQAGALIVEEALVEKCPTGLSLLITKTPYKTFAEIAALFYPEIDQDCYAHKMRIHPTASIGDNVTISESATIGANVHIGDNACIGPNVVVHQGVVIGERCQIQAGVTLAYALLGADVHIQPGVRIGQAGFGFMMDNGVPVDLPHLGRVLIGDNVRIGANTTIDRGSLKDTVIGPGTRIDNLVQIAHNVQIGVGCIIVSQVGIAGSTVVGDYTAMGGQAGIADHVTIGTGARIAAQSGVMKDIPDGATVGGSPSVPIMEWRKQSILLRQMVRSKNRTDAKVTNKES